MAKRNVTLIVVKSNCSLVSANVDLSELNKVTTSATSGQASKSFYLEMSSHKLYWHAEGRPGAKAELELEVTEGLLEKIKSVSGSENIDLPVARLNFIWEVKIEKGKCDGSVTFNLIPSTS